MEAAMLRIVAHRAVVSEAQPEVVVQGLEHRLEVGMLVPVAEKSCEGQPIGVLVSHHQNLASLHLCLDLGNDMNSLCSLQAHGSLTAMLAIGLEADKIGGV